MLTKFTKTVLNENFHIQYTTQNPVVQFDELAGKSCLCETTFSVNLLFNNSVFYPPTSIQEYSYCFFDFCAVKRHFEVRHL